MLTFEQKLAILDSYPQLERRNVSLGRVNYHYEQSRHEKKTVASHLHPNGNGYVFAGLLRGYESDDKGLVNIRDYSSPSCASCWMRRSLLCPYISRKSLHRAKEKENCHSCRYPLG